MLRARSLVAPLLVVVVAASASSECEGPESGLAWRDCRTPEVQTPHATTDQGTGDSVIHAKIRLRCPHPGVDVSAQAEIQRLDRDILTRDDWETIRGGEVEFTADGNAGRWQTRYFPERDADRGDKIACEDGKYRVVVEFPDGDGDNVFEPPPKDIVC